MSDEMILYNNLKEIEDRIEIIENELFKRKNKRVPATLKQKLLLLKHLNILELLKDKFPKNKSREEFLSIILDGDKDNIKHSMAIISHEDSELVTKNNYEFLINIFKELELKEEEKIATSILGKINLEKR